MTARWLMLTAGVAMLHAVVARADDVGYMLATASAELVSAGRNQFVSAVDLQALLAAGGSPDGIDRRIVNNSIAAVVRKALSDMPAWVARFGLPLTGISGMASYLTKAGPRLLWLFPDAAVAAQFLEELKARGFRSDSDGWIVEGELRRLFMKFRGQQDGPFRVYSGEFVALKQDTRIVRQEERPEVSWPAVALDPSFSAALAALQTAAVHVTLVQAVAGPLGLELPRLSQPGYDDVPGGRPNDPRTVPNPPLPFTPLAILADVEVGGATYGAIVVLPYLDCETASTASRRFSTRWQQTPVQGQALSGQSRPDGDTSATTVENGAYCSAVIRVISTATRDRGSNPIFEAHALSLPGKIAGPGWVGGPMRMSGP